MTSQDLSTLETLPLELLRSICELLPLNSAAALALTSKSLLSRLGWRYFGELHGDYANKPETRRFLKLLARDLPQHWACLDCLRLHLHHWARPPHSNFPGEAADDNEWEKRGEPNECPLAGIDDDAEKRLFGGRSDISWRRLNDIMRAYVAGQDVERQLEELAFTHDDYRFIEPTRMLAFRINGKGQLLMREQYYHMPMQRTINNIVCSEYDASFPTSPSASLFAQLLNCALSHACPADQQLCLKCSRLISCHLCATEFTLVRKEDVGKYSTGRPEPIKIVVTRWLNLGNLSEPFEPFWRCHLNHRALDWSAGNGEPKSLVEWRPGSILEEWERCDTRK